MGTPFEKRLQNGPIVVADGGMGTLVSGAVPRLRFPEEANLRSPETVVSLHVSFINAGADLIETNTFGANRRKLKAHHLEDQVEPINSAGVKLAREAREIAAVCGVSSLPVVAMLTFDEQGETLGGVTARRAVEALSDLGLAAVGANHGQGVHAALTALNEMHAADGQIALAAMPNMGLASLAGSRVVFPHATPEYFSDFAAHARDLGAKIIGGGCGG